MAKTYLGYERRADLVSVVDWTSIGDKLSKDLEKAGNIAGKYKKSVDDTNRKSLKNFSESISPLTNNPNVMQSALMAKQQAGDAYRQMQKGEMSMNDYLAYMQNFNSGTKNYVNFYTQQGEQDKLHQERLLNSGQLDNNGDLEGASQIEISSYSRLREFLNPENTKTYVGPDGNWYTSIYDDNGAITKTMSLLQMQLVSPVKTNPYKYNSQISNIVDSFGKQQVRDADGRITSDPRERQGYNNSLNIKVDEVVNNPNTQPLGSILVDYLGYNPVFSKDEIKNEKDILFEYKNVNGLQTPVVSEENISKYKDIVRKNMKQKINDQFDVEIKGNSDKTSLSVDEKKFNFYSNMKSLFRNEVNKLTQSPKETFGGKDIFALEAPQTTAEYFTRIFESTPLTEWQFEGGNKAKAGPLTLISPPDVNGETKKYVIEAGNPEAAKAKMEEILMLHMPSNMQNLLSQENLTNELFLDPQYISKQLKSSSTKKKLPGKK